MSQRHSASHRAGSNMDSSAVTVKGFSLIDFCPTSSFNYSGHHELSESCSLNKKEKEPMLTYEHPETPSLGSLNPAVSPSQIKKSVSLRKEKDKSPELCETPKLRRKKCTLRRQLDLSFTLLKGDSDSQSRSLESSISQGLSLEKHLPGSTSGFPKEDNFSPLVTSTIKTDDVVSSSQNSRLHFSQHKTSTIDDSKDNCGLFEVECLSPIEGNDFKDSITHFSDSSLSVSDENTCPELPGSCGSQTNYGADVTTSVTPVSSLIAKIKFNGSQTLDSSAEVRDSLSTPEDSGFCSLSWDKSEDFLSDQEGSFQELLQKHRVTPKVGDLVKKPKHFGRFRRLSTLQEQGSQSEDETQTAHPNSEPRVGTALGVLERQQGSEERSGDLALSFKDLSHTPALQLVHELFMRSKRKRSQQEDDQEFFEDREEGKIARLQRVLAGLIGKKMGIEQLDILTELQYRNLKHILAMVLESLTSESLYSAWNVSRNWREIVAQDKKANRRRKLYVTQLKARAQGAAVLRVQDAATRLRLLSRLALRSVQAQAQAPSGLNEQVPTLSPWGDVLTPVASSSLTHLRSKQEQYVKVARTLFTDEALKPCPRCQSPAKYQPHKKRGLCSRLACGFDFCVLCLCAYHGSEDCRRGSAKARGSKDVLPGSAQSKRNLKRL
ncbi:F-box only protein 43 isoform X2 [Mus pahari]|nr:F-box only protein 43 isoform X2 [Mus pahari]